MTDETKKEFTSSLLSDPNKKIFEEVQSRINNLQKSREDIYGVNLEDVWAEADKAYIPHRLKEKGKKVIVTDETKGWRGSNVVNLGANNWQADVSNANPFVKLNIALAILVDRNPKGVLTATQKKYEQTTLLTSQLYQRSWEIAKSKQQLKLFILNLGKYGWACGRTYPYKLTRKGKVIKEYNAEDPSKTVYEEKEATIYNDIMRENLDPWNVWMDDMAKPNNSFSIRDWTWRKIYDRDTFDEEFGKCKFHKYVKEGGVTTEKIDKDNQTQKKYQENKLIEVKFYENIQKDLYVVIANGVPIVMEPLPISDSEGRKKLSLWQGYWTLRHSNSPYGVGIYEAMRFENALLDRIRNMTIDQLTLAIYKSWFYQGTQSLTETGDLVLSPGKGHQTLDPKNIKFVEVPPPGKEAWEGIQMLQKEIDTASGITPPLAGEIVGTTAYETAQSKEAALGRLKFPLDNICDALEQEGYITISLMQLLYSIPEVIEITDPSLIDAYLNETGADPSLFERIQDPQTGQSVFKAKLYPEFPLNMEEDKGGNLVETEKTKFFRIKPKFLSWEGIFNIEAQSVLTPSKQLDKSLGMEMYNVLIPLLVQPPELYSKVAKSIVKLYDKDPKDILPDIWMMENIQRAQPLFTQGMDQNGKPINPQEGQQQPQTSAPTFVGNTQPANQPQGIAQRIVSKLSAPFRRM